MHVRLFRRNGKDSFSVQLSPSSGVVEVRCSSIEVLPPQGFAMMADRDLEERLLLLGRKEFGCMGGFEVEGNNRVEGDSVEAGSTGWKVILSRLGPFSIEDKAFVQCSMVFDGRGLPLETKNGQRRRKKSLGWCQQKNFA